MSSRNKSVSPKKSKAELRKMFQEDKKDSLVSNINVIPGGVLISKQELISARSKKYEGTEDGESPL